MRARRVCAAPAASAAVLAAEADIAATRARLDRAVAALRHDLAVSLAVTAGIRTLMGRTGGGRSPGAFLRQNAAPIGLVVVGLAWLGLRNRDRLSDLRRVGGAQFLEAAQTLGKNTAGVALAAILKELWEPRVKAGPASNSPESDSGDQT